MNDLFKSLIDNHLYLISWPEKKKISIETEIFKYSYSASMGAVIVKSLKEEINFQDLQSILRFMEVYLKSKIELKDCEKDDIIIFQALRHVIVHNMSTIDTVFLRQVRNTRYKDKYKDGNNVQISESDYKLAKKVFETFSLMILNPILEKEIKYLEEKIK